MWASCTAVSGCAMRGALAGWWAGAVERNGVNFYLRMQRCRDLCVI